jgi:hypothetical protein
VPASSQGGPTNRYGISAILRIRRRFAKNGESRQ